MRNIKTNKLIFALIAGLIVFSGSTASAISENEAVNFVNDRYRECLKRAPDNGGLNHYVNRLLSGSSKSSVRSDICNSPEAQAVRDNNNQATNSAYQPSTSGISENEAVTFVNNKYRECLRRAPDNSGLNHYVNRLLSGSSKSSVRSDICNSPEAQNVRDNNNQAVVSHYSNDTNSSSNSNSSSIPSCSLSGDYVQSLGREVFYATEGKNHKKTISGLNIPSGTYNITIQTWDDHSGHGGQGQTKEIVHVNLYNSDTMLVEGLRTNDVPENSDTKNTTFRNIDIDGTITRIFAKHAYYRDSNTPESVVPVCISFDEVYTPVNNDFDVECRVSDRKIEEGDEVRYEAIVTGGNSPFDYDWDGDVNGSSRTVEVEYDDEGSYYASVTVTDDEGRTRSDSCPVVIVEEEDEDDDLEVQCEISDRRIEEGDRVTIEVDIDGGNGPYDIEWSGDADEIDDFDDNDRRQTLRIDDEGRYDLRVTVEDDDGNRDSDRCTLIVEDDNGISTVNNGDLAGLSSVYLNQVPYTGPEDVAKILGFISLILIWSSLVAYYLLKGKKRKQVSNRIQAFKEANKLRA